MDQEESSTTIASTTGMPLTRREESRASASIVLVRDAVAEGGRSPSSALQAPSPAGEEASRFARARAPQECSEHRPEAVSLSWREKRRAPEGQARAAAPWLRRPLSFSRSRRSLDPRFLEPVVHADAGGNRVLDVAVGDGPGAQGSDQPRRRPPRPRRASSGRRNRPSAGAVGETGRFAKSLSTSGFA